MIRQAIPLIAPMIAAVAFAANAGAAPPAAPSPLGAWEFKTGVIGACTISGKMTVGKPAKAGAPYPCLFESVQACPGLTPPAYYTVAQSCTAQVSGSKVMIKSKVERIISVKPEWALEGVKKGYAPDDFTVEINARATQMTGVFYSHGQAKVTFWRPSNDRVS